MRADSELRGWVLYDATCGFCTWWIPFWRSTIQAAGYDIAPLQSTWVREKIALDGVEINRDIICLLKDGRQLVGADAYLYGMKQVWWSRPVGYLLSFPGLKQVTWLAYRVFNRNRFLVSRICRLPPEIDNRKSSHETEGDMGR